MAIDKNKEYKISGKSYFFIINSSMAVNDEAVHVHVRIHPDFEDDFSNLSYS